MNINRRSTSYLALLVAAALPASGAALARKPLELDPIAVEAAPAEGDTVIGAEQLERTQAKDLREVFENEPAVSVGGGGAPIAQKLYVRGVEDTLLNVSLDGAPQGGFIYHHQGRIVIDPSLLKAVEVDKGAAGASAGPGALAGAVRFTTKDAEDLLGEGERFGVRLGGSAFFNDGWDSQLTAFGRLGDSASVLVSGSRTDLDNYEDGHGDTVESTAARQDSGLAKLSWRPADGHRVGLGYHAVEDEGVRYLRPNFVGFPGNDTPLPTEFERETLTLNYDFAGRGSVSAAEVVVFDDDNRNRRTNAGRTYGEQVEGRGANLKLTSEFGKHRVNYGANYHSYDSRSLNPVNVGNAAVANGADNTGEEEASVIGVFVEDDMSLTRSLLLSVGARYDWYDYTDNHDQEFDSGGVSPSAALTVLATDALSLRVGYARSYRGVGLKEAFLLDNGPGPRLYRNDADLDGETAQNLEFGVDYGTGNWVLAATVFRQTIDDYIGTQFVDGQARRSNLGEVEIPGYEASVAYRWRQLKARLGVAEAEPELEGRPLNDSDFGLGVTSGRTWLLSLDYRLPGYNVELGWTSRYVEDLRYAPADSPDTRLTKEGYDVHDISARWLPLGNDRLALTLTVRNVFDEFYYDHATYAFNVARDQVLGFAEPGRDVRLGATVTF